MPNYKSMYYTLAAQVANAIDLLIKAQQQGESAAIESESSIRLFDLHNQGEEKQQEYR